MSATDDPLQSVVNAIVSCPRDWSEERRDAWLYGIAVGWGEALQDVADAHDWSAEKVAHLQRLHLAFVAAKESHV